MNQERPDSSPEIKPNQDIVCEYRTVNKAIMAVTSVVAKVEQEFKEKFSKDFDLSDRKDFVKLASILNITDVLNESRLDPNGEDDSFANPERFAHYEIGQTLIVNYLTNHKQLMPTLEASDRDEAIEGLVGHLFYNVPNSYWHHMSDLIENQIKKGNEEAVQAGFATIYDLYTQLYNTLQKHGSLPLEEEQLVQVSFSDVFAHPLCRPHHFFDSYDKGAEVRSIRALVEDNREWASRANSNNFYY